MSNDKSILYPIRIQAYFLFVLFTLPISAISQDITSISIEAERWSFLAMADVPLDSIPDKILTKDAVIEAVILGFLAETLTTEAKLMYLSDKSGRTLILPLSKIVRIYDGKTRRNIALPVHAYFSTESNNNDKHRGTIRFVKGFAKGFFLTYGVGLISLLMIIG